MKKELLKSRKRAGGEKREQRTRDLEDAYERYEVKALRDVVLAPPAIRTTPKAVFKDHSAKRAFAKTKRPSLLPVLGARRFPK